MVNVASRLAGEAGPGEILVSEWVARRGADAHPLRFESVGAMTLKNVAKPVDVFRLVAATDGSSE